MSKEFHLSEFSAPLPALGQGWNRAIYSALPAALVPRCACCFLHKMSARRRTRGAATHQIPASLPLEKTLQWRPAMHDGLGARPTGAVHFPPCPMPSCSCFVLPSGFPELYGCPNHSWWNTLREKHPPKALWWCTCRASHWGHGDVAAELPQPPASHQSPMNAADRGTSREHRMQTALTSHFQF